VNVEEFRRQGHAVVDRMAEYLDALPIGPVWRPVPTDRRAVLTDQLLPAGGTSFDDLLGFVEEHVLPHPFGNGHPRFFGWGNPPPALQGVLAELIAAAMNPSCAGGDQAAVHLERCTTRWLAELVDFPGDGVLVSGGAAGALTALMAARHRAAITTGWDDLVEGITSEHGARLVMYVSAETHSCQHKAARLLGLGDRGITSIPTDSVGRMSVAALRAAVERDVAAGLQPFCVVATAGVVSTGAIDDLDAIAEVCEAHGVWFHVDGSLGGFGRLHPDRRARFAGLERADSLTLDPHKWLSVPIDCGVVLVRDTNELRAAFAFVPPYLRARPGDPPWFAEYVFDQTRPFRALKLWATLAGEGRDGLTQHVTRNVAHAERLARHVDATPGLTLTAWPELNVVTFRYGAGDDALNRQIPALVQRAGSVFVTGARVDDREVVRACFMHPHTTDADIDRIVPEVMRAAETLT
jgi:glutamate/tyrosine decarboxylase-like PLP-dependent enzyme